MTATIPDTTSKRNRNRKWERIRGLLRQRRKRLLKRIENVHEPERDRPMFTASNLHYELAERTHLSPSTISRVETGKRALGLDVLLPLAAALQVSLDALERPAYLTRRIWYGYGTWDYND